MRSQARAARRPPEPQRAAGLQGDRGLHSSSAEGGAQVKSGEMLDRGDRPAKSRHCKFAADRGGLVAPSSGGGGPRARRRTALACRCFKDRKLSV
jgi:hypothetical protein